MCESIRMATQSTNRWAWPVSGALGLIALGSLGGVVFAAGDQGWYQALRHPPGTPPPWVFGPVWTVLYACMGVSLGFLIRDRKVPVYSRAIGPFIAQLVLNLAWTPVFFGAHRVGLALGILIALWLAVALTLGLAWKARRMAGGLLIPYLIWISYALYLNAGCLVLNG